MAHEHLLALCHVTPVRSCNETFRCGVSTGVTRAEHSLTAGEVHAHRLVMPVRFVMASGVSTASPSRAIPLDRGNLLFQFDLLVNQSLFRLTFCLDDVLFGLQLVLEASG